ncbi:thrombospondin-2-like [Crassostrea virginica]
MFRKASVFLLVFIVLCNVVDTVDICQKSTLYDYTMGKKLPGFPIKIFENIGPQSCFRECQAHGNCASVNYNRSEFSCQLMNDRKSESKPLSDDGNFFYLEMKDTVDAGSKTCGDVVCNNYSTCIPTSSDKMICTETECAEPYPLLNNGIILERTYSPISATYGCSPGFTSVGSGNRITCRPGGKWSALSYRCEPPVNGGWGSWYGWGSCSTTCGGGTKQRTRYCNNPVPMYGGNSCSGSSVGSTTCNTNGCPVNGGWGYWSNWSSCSKTCDTGSMSRSRSCNNPYPVYGGSYCSGYSSESANCNTKSCPGWFIGR